MLVYGDRNVLANARECLRELSRERSEIQAMSAGLRRHSHLVNLLIEAGRLLQGLVDDAFQRVGCDRRAGTTDALTEFILELASAVCRSWDASFDDQSELPQTPSLLDLPKEVELRVPEGFAYYAVYPEAFAEAARKITLTAPPKVIGIRSIGTGLGAVVAAAVGARSFFTVRPLGDPYDRRIAVGPQLERELLAGTAHYLIVDEGPGQSGSSFGAVADWLQQRGVPLERIAFVPSHSAPPGSAASAARRALWDRANKMVADFGSRFPELLRHWACDHFRSIDTVIDLSGGKWRNYAFSSEREWPAVNPSWERRKYLLCSNGETCLLKFAGLGTDAERKFDLAQLLSEHVVTPEPLGLLHGFLIERWYNEAQRLTCNDRPLQEIAHYLGIRARLFASDDAPGASVEQLFQMSLRNVECAMGADAATALLRWEPRLRPLQSCVTPVLTDNRMIPHEWIRLSDGRLLKTDALDHHCGHDLVGAQDIAWDVAGAAVEFGLSSAEKSWLAAEVGRSAGRLLDPELLDFLTLAYLAFRLGQVSFSMQMCADQLTEVRRLDAQRVTYSGRLSAELSGYEGHRLDSKAGSLSMRNNRIGGTIPAPLG